MDKNSDVLIVGCGIAALQLARHIRHDFHVIVLTKTKKIKSNSYKAQGGIAAVMSESDTFSSHVQDTLTAGRNHHCIPNVERLVEEGAIAVKELIHSGLPIDRKENGEISLGLEGAHSAHRIVHCGGDATGRYTIDHLLETLPDNVEVIEDEMVIELLLNYSRSRCVGVKTKNAEGSIGFYHSAHIVLATGGAGSLYPFTSNDPAITGDGIALAFRAGAKVADMEFIQFHPTLLYANGQASGLISEAVRGEGGVIVDQNGKRVMEGVHPLKDLAPRHVTAYEIYKARNSGKETYIDINGIDHFEEKFPTITAICQANGVQVKDGLLPVTPGSHFLMGGIVIDSYGRTSIEGLYAVGETACSGVHGANRLASNSLLEGLVYGKRTAHYINNHQPQRVENLLFSYRYDISPKDLGSLKREELLVRMMDYVGIIREESQLRTQVEWLNGLSIPSLFSGSFDRLSCDQIEDLFMHINAYLISVSALMRRESRGAHIRTDFPQEDCVWKGKYITHTMSGTKVENLYESNQTRVYA